MNVTLVTHDSVFARFVAAELYVAGKLDQIIVETGYPSWRYFWRKYRRVGLTNGVFQWWLNRWFRREGRRYLPIRPFPPHTRVPTANDLSFGADDLVLGFGSSFITARTLRRMPRGFLNLHTGWLPDYRGVKSEFWTLARGDNDRTGWTLHYMVPELDAGDIVLQHRVPLTTANPAELRAQLLQDAVPVLCAFIETVRHQGFQAIGRHPQTQGRYYTTPTYAEWRAYRLDSPKRATRATSPRN